MPESDYPLSALTCASKFLVLIIQTLSLEEHLDYLLTTLRDVIGLKNFSMTTT